ncbi:hypothetical protein ElP_65130 [Tautonia plasticadhaerens]|uniref:Uncharacterized protein n=1 Tax=Tautonia plasticadhaerens TaxID=2527974 RepID=A0A518HCH1_9BACT|nr:hypothetical protein ElP_65130 [Tautonia plasticadhaerens]
MAQRLSIQLRSLGCDTPPSDFRKDLVAIKEELFPDWSDEALSYTRDEADRYCQAVCLRVGVKLPRDFILRQLNNVRKRSCTTLL